MILLTYVGGERKKTMMFTQKELSKFYGVLQNTPEFIEIECGCTNPRYGDTPGILRVSLDGSIMIYCTCLRNCNRGMCTIDHC